MTDRSPPDQILKRAHRRARDHPRWFKEELGSGDAEGMCEQQLSVEPGALAARRADRDDGRVERIAHRYAGADTEAAATPARWHKLPAHRRSGLRGLGQQPALLVGLKRGGELVKVSLQHAIKVMDRDLYAVVGDAALGEVVGADLLSAVARADL